MRGIPICDSKQSCMARQSQEEFDLIADDPTFRPVPEGG